MQPEITRSLQPLPEPGPEPGRKLRKSRSRDYRRGIAASERAVPDSRFTAAQKGVPLAEAMPSRSAAEAKKSRKEQQARRGAKKSAAARARSKAAGGTTPAATLPAPASLSTAERLRLLAAFETGARRRLHAPAAEARPLRLRPGAAAAHPAHAGRSSSTDDAFHLELADIVTRMRDAHTRYAGPATLASKVAALPFLVEMIGSVAAPTYVVTKVGAGLDAGFKPGVRAASTGTACRSTGPCSATPTRSAAAGPTASAAWAVQSLTLAFAAVRPAARRALGRRRLPQTRRRRARRPASAEGDQGPLAGRRSRRRSRRLLAGGPTGRRAQGVAPHARGRSGGRSGAPGQDAAVRAATR